MKKLFTLFLFALLAITSAWAETLTYTYNLNDKTAYPNDFPTSSASSSPVKAMEYMISGHPLIINAPTSCYIIAYGSDNGTTRGLFFGKTATSNNNPKDGTAYLQFPALSGYVLKKVDLTTTSGIGGSISLNIYDASWKAYSTSQSTTASTSKTFSFDLTNPQANTAYRLSSGTSGKNIQLTKIILTYESTSTTPGKTATSLSFGADWDGKTITKYIGDEDILNCPATLTPAVEGATITYESSDENVAVIDENGAILLGNAVGKTTITASYAGNGTYDASSASFTIDLQKLPDPTFSPAPGAVVAGTVVTIKAPIDGATIDVSYEPEGEATVNVKDVAETTITISKPTYIIAQTVYNGIKSDGVEANYTINELTGDTYTLVTSDKDLESGAKYVLVNKTGDKIASAFSTDKITTVGSNGNYDLDTNNNIVTVLSDEVNVFTFTGDATNGWTITDKKNVVYTSSNQNELSSGTATLHTISISEEDGTVKISAKSYPKRQWKFNSSMFRNYGTGTGSAPYLYKAGTVVVKPAAPTFNPESGTAFDTETATVTITAPEGCTLKYTVGSGAEQTSASNTAKVTVSPTAYTITAKSVNADGVESNEATATYTFNVVAHVKNIAEFMALEPNATAIFDNPVVVLYDYSQPSLKKTDGQYLSNPEYIWVKDESGQTNLYLEEAIDPTNHQAKYENGDVIPAGFKAVKNYYIDGKFYQALVDTDNKSLLADASHKRLADPVTITFDVFNGLVTGVSEKALADSAQWSNTYVMIQNVTMSADASDKWGKTYFVYQDGVKATSNVFYNKYSDTRNETEIPLTKQGEDGRVSMPFDGATKQYNVYGILQVYNNIWEIMPIRFVEYSAQTLTLKELVELGKANSTTSTTEYTILNDLRGVRALPGNVILAKDENGNAVDKVTPAGNSFMINAKSKFDDAATEESVNAKAQEDYDQSNWVEIVLPSSVSAADYVDHIITGMTVKGNYTDTTNPRLVATAAPTAGGATGAYTRNAMCPANFMGTSQACNAEQNHGDFFFMTPKPNECVQVVWAVYNSTAKAFYIPAAQGSINSHGFKGAFSIDWAYNADGKITNLTDGNLYQFAAVVKKIEPAPRSPKRKVAYVNNQPLSSDYVVFPLNLDANYVTGITETTGTKTVKSVRYFNIMGVELAEPTAGVNIVLTTYTDGTTHSQKILK